MLPAFLGSARGAVPKLMACTKNWRAVLLCSFWDTRITTGNRNCQLVQFIYLLKIKLIGCPTQNLNPLNLKIGPTLV